MVESVRKDKCEAFELETFECETSNCKVSSKSKMGLLWKDKGKSVVKEL